MYNIYDGLAAHGILPRDAVKYERTDIIAAILDLLHKGSGG